MERIKKRLILPVKIKTKNERANKNTNVTLSYDEKNPLNGIFHHLTKITNEIFKKTILLKSLVQKYVVENLKKLLNMAIQRDGFTF